MATHNLQMPSGKKLLLEHFILPSLNSEKFGHNLEWVDPVQRNCFRVVYHHKNSRSWSTGSADVFAAWDELKGRRQETHDYFTQARQRFRVALSRCPQLEKVPIKGEKCVQVFRILSEKRPERKHPRSDKRPESRPENKPHPNSGTIPILPAGPGEHRIVFHIPQYVTVSEPALLSPTVQCDGQPSNLIMPPGNINNSLSLDDESSSSDRMEILTDYSDDDQLSMDETSTNVANEETDILGDDTCRLDRITGDEIPVIKIKEEVESDTESTHQQETTSEELIPVTNIKKEIDMDDLARDICNEVGIFETNIKEEVVDVDLDTLTGDINQQETMSVDSGSNIKVKEEEIDTQVEYANAEGSTSVQGILNSKIKEEMDKIIKDICSEQRISVEPILTTRIKEEMDQLIKNIWQKQRVSVEGISNGNAEGKKDRTPMKDVQKRNRLALGRTSNTKLKEKVVKLTGDNFKKDKRLLIGTQNKEKTNRHGTDTCQPHRLPTKETVGSRRDKEVVFLKQVKTEAVEDEVVQVESQKTTDCKRIGNHAPRVRWTKNYMVRNIRPKSDVTPIARTENHVGPVERTSHVTSSTRTKCYTPPTIQSKSHAIPTTLIQNHATPVMGSGITVLNTDNHTIPFIGNGSQVTQVIKSGNQVTQLIRTNNLMNPILNAKSLVPPGHKPIKILQLIPVVPVLQVPSADTPKAAPLPQAFKLVSVSETSPKLILCHNTNLSTGSEQSPSIVNNLSLMTNPS